jgi:hypothetical protein
VNNPSEGLNEPTRPSNAPGRRLARRAAISKAQFDRLRARRGAKKAIGSVAASMLTAAHHMLKDGTLYQDLGAAHFDRRAKGAATKRLIAKLESLGYDVQITPVTA